MIHSRRVHRRALRRGVGSFQSGLYSACGVARFQASSNAALHVGPLWVSQPFLVIIDPIVSVALSVWLFGERFTKRRPGGAGTGPGRAEERQRPAVSTSFGEAGFQG